jgi:NADH dehydrogenase FAD-containing subunit
MVILTIHPRSCTSGFEKADHPNLSTKEKEALLHFAIVGGGPTGVEFAAELFDLISEDIVKLYPRLADKVSMTIYEYAISFIFVLLFFVCLI